MPERICFRYNPGPELTRGNAIIGTPEEAKYGMTYDQLMTCVDWAKKKGISYIGIHTMVISAELELPGLLGTISMMCDLANDIRDKKGITVDFIDFGGGILNRKQSTLKDWEKAQGNSSKKRWQDLKRQESALNAAGPLPVRMASL